MWGLSIPINLHTVLFAVMAPILLIAFLARQPTVALIVAALLVAVLICRRAVRRRRQIAELQTAERYERHMAELHADAVEQRLRKWDR